MTTNEPIATKVLASQQTSSNQQANRQANQQPPSNNSATNNQTTINTITTKAITTNPSRNTSNPKKRRSGTIINETLTTSGNASRYRKALKLTKSQASVHGLRV